MVQDHKVSEFGFLALIQPALDGAGNPKLIVSGSSSLETATPWICLSRPPWCFFILAIEFFERMVLQLQEGSS
ncbi:MAG: hypothetical protein NTX90_16445 [Alphaproteobacteria bacterium]|jgi:hypothetical protein|nr:hypothetical protein [Alphaproteobacteria bacterium]